MRIVFLAEQLLWTIFNVRLRFFAIKFDPKTPRPKTKNPKDPVGNKHTPGFIVSFWVTKSVRIEFCKNINRMQRHLSFYEIGLKWRKNNSVHSQQCCVEDKSWNYYDNTSITTSSYLSVYCLVVRSQLTLFCRTFIKSGKENHKQNWSWQHYGLRPGWPLSSFFSNPTKENDLKKLKTSI